jgi:hypothetical protein
MSSSWEKSGDRAGGRSGNRVMEIFYVFTIVVITPVDLSNPLLKIDVFYFM